MGAPQSRNEANGTAPTDITGALNALRKGAPGADDRLANLVYGSLRAMAHRQLQAERVDHTLATTGLVHEAYLKLVDQTRAEWSDRAHFFAVAARAMRRILVDYARKHRALRAAPSPRLERPVNHRVYFSAFRTVAINSQRAMTAAGFSSHARGVRVRCGF